MQMEINTVRSQDLTQHEVLSNHFNALVMLMYIIMMLLYNKRIISTTPFLNIQRKVFRKEKNVGIIRRSIQQKDYYEIIRRSIKITLQQFQLWNCTDIMIPNVIIKSLSSTEKSDGSIRRIIYITLPQFQLRNHKSLLPPNGSIKT